MGGLVLVIGFWPDSEGTYIDDYNPRVWKLISAQGQVLGMDVSDAAPPRWFFPPDHPHYIDPKHEAVWVEDRDDCCIELGFRDYLVEEFHDADIYLPGERDDTRRADPAVASS